MFAHHAGAILHALKSVLAVNAITNSIVLSVIFVVTTASSAVQNIPVVTAPVAVFMYTREVFVTPTAETHIELSFAISLTNFIFTTWSVFTGRFVIDTYSPIFVPDASSSIADG